ncbi:hypothetical protein [Nostoc sp.]|uniref:hypothetical protein n=1 Tax=Nostoc sp. TaxID=1180 RepID=UPI002FF4707B
MPNQSHTPDAYEIPTAVVTYLNQSFCVESDRLPIGWVDPRKPKICLYLKFILF